MSPDKQKSLSQKYPQIFADLGGDPRETCMAWGLEVGDGWHDIIDRLCADIMAIDPGPEFKATQVKEKFGGLRFYTTSVPTDKSRVVSNRISEAEAESYKTCEDCGTKDGVSTEGPGWIGTLCGSCRAIRRAETRKAAGLE